ncbi:GIY-YIG nuclease family protein [Skermanella rosea]|uniref:GIY-YIG nuclease family protein n=1 Tax=Skermanella rosea TaxID=1817965 RepID=UPI00193171FA|nr:GIY-YIG nuclease family protein [Skermanella rosea]UEM06315.1 GIY-YIG nuclease family protein [Skermanella rosea]
MKIYQGDFQTLANKLAGQRAKFSRGRALFYTADDDSQRLRAVRLMAEVLAHAPKAGFSEDEVTQGAEIPREVLKFDPVALDLEPETGESDDQAVASLARNIDVTDVVEIGEGAEFVYAYGYRCAPDRLKIGSTVSDVTARVTAQIGTGTPDRPRLMLTIRTHDCRALERALHHILRFKGRHVTGAGAEWFITTRDEVRSLYDRIVS